MEEVEFISEKDVKRTIENFSIEELVDYKKKLLDYVVLVEEAINKRNMKKKRQIIFLSNI